MLLASVHRSTLSFALGRYACARTSVCTAYSSRSIQHHASRQKLPPLAFTFDIDGVLLRGPHTIPAARRALDMLNGANPMRVTPKQDTLHPGGWLLSSGTEGVTDATTSLPTEAALAKKHLQQTQILQAHTILKSVVHKYENKPVLVLGGRNDDVRKVAEGYGFKHVYTTLDVLAWKPEVWPFHELTPEERASTKPVDFSQTPISAIFVFHDPRNWSLDIQIIIDVLRARGIIGGPYLDTPEHADHHGDGRIHGKDANAPIELVFCNPDLLWKSDFPQPRLGQGAFREAFQAVYKALVGKAYPYVQYGKPTTATYKFAEKVLKDRLEELQGGPVDRLPAVYMVGDNPESDIAGANGAGWESVLVRTGVYDPAQGPPAHTPTYVAEDVEEAVRWAIERSMGRKVD
ncbi:hypothetical protein ONZ51_g6464 [Trametes cubensis]|uniref:HAD hydrolase n=1 Tax=Trametes cubensis TaxID=1111947 RepID=A0AAD7X8C3_9APHY|nr:hypothetical protein ONZ51_g6464 [Trametes cubensis]